MESIKIGSKDINGLIVIEPDDNYIINEMAPGQFKISRKDGKVIENIGDVPLYEFVRCYVMNRVMMANEMILVRDVPKVIKNMKISEDRTSIIMDLKYGESEKSVVTPDIDKKEETDKVEVKEESKGKRLIRTLYNIFWVEHQIKK